MTSKKGKLFFKDIFERVCQCNYIAIGGMFGVGKSTLTKELAKELKLEPILELNETDHFSESLLSAMYSKTDTWIDGISNEWFCYKRYDMHQRVSKSKKGFVIDGTIFQQPVISNILDVKSLQNPFDVFVRELCEKTAYRLGIPKLYIIIDLDWENVKARIFKRGRKYEIENFEINKETFKKLSLNYVEELKKECVLYRIPYLIINGKMSTKEQIEYIKKYLKDNNIDVYSKKANKKYLPLVKSPVIAIGGMIAAGKSTLTHTLAKKLDWEYLDELKEKDDWQMCFLKAFYDQKSPSYIKQMFQTYIPQYRIKVYKKKLLEAKKPLVVDRTIFEDRIFASLALKDSKVLKYYNRLWYDIANDLAYNTGLPELYVFLDLKFDNFEQRIFDRGRQSEIDNFDVNRPYFKTLHYQYIEKMVELCKRFEIDYIILDANMPTEQQIQEIINHIKTNKKVFNLK